VQLAGHHVKGQQDHGLDCGDDGSHTDARWHPQHSERSLLPSVRCHCTVHLDSTDTELFLSHRHACDHVVFYNNKHCPPPAAQDRWECAHSVGVPTCSVGRSLLGKRI
jgi:hypothetical protein